MKRLWPLLLVLVLLAGCAGQEEPTTAPTTAPVETEPSGLYLPESEVQKATGDAVRAYGLDSNSYLWAAAFGQDLLLATDAGELTLLTGERCVPAVTAVTAAELTASAAELGQTYSQVYYLDTAANELAVLGSDLQQARRIPMPESFQGVPVLSGQTGEVFYCAGQDIRALDPETGISRLVKQQSCQSCQLLGGCFEGRVLICENVDTLDQRHILYVDAATGQTLAGDDHIYQLQTYGDAYFVMRLDGVTQQQIFGTLETAPQQLHIPQTSTISPVLSLGGVAAWQSTETGLRISFYDTASGLCTASTELPGEQAPVCITADSSYIWILAASREGADQLLYRWDITKSPVTDETVYTTPLYTVDAPDEAGLALCQTRADALSDQFQVHIRIWQDAVKDPGIYLLEPEHQTYAIDRWLDELTATLEMFPEGFFKACVKGSGSGRLNICLARGVATGEQTLYYWDNGGGYIVMAPGTHVQKELVRAVGYVMDTRLMGNSQALNTWDTMTGEGFVYGEIQPDSPYLEGDTRAFVDQQSMLSPREDRARIFEAAVAADAQDLFTAPVLQAKLLCLCQGIRESFDLEKHPEVLPWEQYLSESLAYTEE